MAQADAQAQELSALTLQNNVEDPADPLTSLPPELLQKPLKFLKVDDVLEAKPVSKLMRSAARFVLTRVLLKPVKFVADQGEALCRAGAVPTASCDIFRAAWAADPDEAFRLCLTWTVEVNPEEADDWVPDYPKLVFTPQRAARFLAVVEPTIDGLGRIMVLCERAHRFTYAGRKMEAAMPLDMYHYVEEVVEQIIGFSVESSALKIIFAWAREIRYNMATDAGVQAVREGLAGALESWADPAVAAHFAAGFFPASSEMRTSIVATAQQLSRRWEDRGKAADFAAAAFTVEFEDRQKRLRTGQSEEWEGMFQRECHHQSYADPGQSEFWTNLAPVVAELDETLHLAGNDGQISTWPGHKVQDYFSQIAEMTMRPGDFY